MRTILVLFLVTLKSTTSEKKNFSVFSQGVLEVRSGRRGHNTLFLIVNRIYFSFSYVVFCRLEDDKLHRQQLEKEFQVLRDDFDRELAEEKSDFQSNSN